MTTSFQPLTISIVGAGIGGLTAAVRRLWGSHARGEFTNLYPVSVSSQCYCCCKAANACADYGDGKRLEGRCHFALNLLYLRATLKYTVESTEDVGLDLGVEGQFEGVCSSALMVEKASHTRGSLLACTRTDLYEEPKRLATGEGEGPPAQLRLGTKVVACDIEEGMVTLDGGEVVHSDFILGADGIRIQKTTLAAWTPTATLEEFVAKFRDFDPKFLHVLDLPMLSPIYRWTLRVLPLLLTLGQGAGMGIEEAGALGCLLPLDPIDLPNLKYYSGPCSCVRSSSPDTKSLRYACLLCYHDDPDVELPLLELGWMASLETLVTIAPSGLLLESAVLGNIAAHLPFIKGVEFRRITHIATLISPEDVLDIATHLKKIPSLIALKFIDGDGSMEYNSNDYDTVKL
ncbi:hypothetical protein K438DRAFT_2044767 [Mycena galopus ATCC 62051]|nr:hypothetical protein K438DRAFT_2044767 [Mycena galopus ATCC 62051]